MEEESQDWDYPRAQPEHKEQLSFANVAMPWKKQGDPEFRAIVVHGS